LVIEVSLIIIEWGTRSVGCLTREVLPEGHSRKRVSEFIQGVYGYAPLRDLYTGGESVVEQGV